MSILRIRDKDGVVHEVLALRGKDGEDGKDYILTEEDKQDIAAEVPNYVTADSIGAAPAGYGLGQEKSISQNWNTQSRNGFYREILNGPDDKNTWYGITCASFKGESTNIAFSPADTNGSTMVLRHRNSSTFKDWEYVNPPMLEGVEYRTTERFNGKPVYTKLIATENLNIPESSAAPLSTTTVVSDESVNIIDIKAELNRDGDDLGYFPLPYIYNGKICAYIYAGYVTQEGKTVVSIVTTNDITTILAGSTYTAHITVKYTKDETAPAASTTE